MTLGNKNTQGDEECKTRGREITKFIMSLLIRRHEVVERMQNQIAPKVQQVQYPETVRNEGRLCRKSRLTSDCSA